MRLVEPCKMPFDKGGIPRPALFKTVDLVDLMFRYAPTVLVMGHFCFAKLPHEREIDH